MKGIGRLDMFSSDGLKITEVSNFGDFLFTSCQQMFYDCSNVVFSAADHLRTDSGNYTFCFFSTGSSFPNILNPQILRGCFRNTSLNEDLGYINLRDAYDMAQFALNVTTWSQANYEATWLGWLGWESGAPTITLRNTVTFDGGNSTVGIGSDGAAARAYAINTLGWTITDGGEV